MPPGYELKGGDDEPKEEKHIHEIMASNFFMGVARFVKLRLPARWRLGAGRMVPEVGRTREVGGELWVMEGNSTHVMYDQKGLRAYELQIHVVEGIGDGAAPRSLELLREMKVAKHSARAYHGQVQQGLLRRKSVPMVAVTFACPETGRRIRLELRGRLEGKELELFLDSLGDLVCH